MTARRRTVANGIVLALLAGQAAAVLADRELWPFSPYPMYSTLQTGTITRLWLYRVGADGTEEPLDDRTALAPPRLAALETGLARMDRDARHEALRDLLARCEQRHDGRAFKALRLYRMSWDAARGDRDHPIARELLAEAP